MDKISIVIPVFNTAEYLAECLDSLLSQTYQNIEIICVNDGSTDNSLDVLKKYEKKSSLITVIDQKNQGVSAARNNGISFATGNYLMFVDSDDWVDIKICETLLSEAHKYNADCVMCSYCKEYGNRTIDNHVFNTNLVLDEQETRNQIYRRLFGPVGAETAHPHEVDILVSVWMQLFKADLCKKAKFIDTKKVGNEDCLYQMMVYKNCKKFVYIDIPMYHYRKTNETSFTTSYNPYLFDRWQNKYTIMEKMISDGHYPDIYKEALNNRIMFALIGLGLNEVNADQTLLQKSKRLEYIVSRERYKKAFRTLNIRYMPVYWKVFFILLKNQSTVPVIIMLQIIQKLRGR